MKVASNGFADVTVGTPCTGGTQTVTAFCAATTCKVSKAYEQNAASTGCSGHCDASQATGSAQPTLTFNALNGRVCMTFAGAQALNTPAYTPGRAQPISMSHVVKRTGAFTSFGTLVAVTSGLESGFNNSANSYYEYGGILLAATASDSSFHAIQTVANSGSSAVVVDGSATTGGASTLGFGAGNAINLGNKSAGNFLTGVLCEVSVWASAFSATDYGNLNTNQHGSFGYNF